MQLGYDAGIIAVLKLIIRFDFLHAGGNDNRGYIQISCGFITVGFERNRIIADVAVDFINLCIGKNLNLGMCPDLIRFGLYNPGGR